MNDLVLMSDGHSLGVLQFPRLSKPFVETARGRHRFQPSPNSSAQHSRSPPAINLSTAKSSKHQFPAAERSVFPRLLPSYAPPIASGVSDQGSGGYLHGPRAAA